ncbi:DUF1189 family protein [Enterococcus gallinarum]|uniref:DUF1189 family protein n=1 Tax=Enterococcus gallinarum TaxID=1353 RepID=UPI001559CE92|nr:DUF1189 family protein [Enterococcus gallinarum]NQE03365.1 DUF1189 domain-containing protein [Enterococcus gallinarum]
MTFTEMLKNALFKFEELNQAKEAPFSKIIVFVVGLSMLLAIPLTIQVTSVFYTLKDDGQKIAAAIPDFKIEHGQLVTTENSEGFVYQTNSIIFTFDPEGKRESNDISNDMIGNIISIGLLKDELIISLPSVGLSSSILDSSNFRIPYNEPAIQRLNGDSIRKTLHSATIPWWMQLMIFLVALYPSFLNLILTLLMGTFIANIYSKLSRHQGNFFGNLKIFILAAVVPTIIGTIVQLINPNFDATTFVILGGIFLFAQGTKNGPKIPLA